MAQDESGRFAGKLHRTRTIPGAALEIAPALEEIGSLELTFATATAGHLTYTIDGTTMLRPIERYTFGAGRVICALSPDVEEIR